MFTDAGNQNCFEWVEGPTSAPNDHLNLTEVEFADAPEQRATEPQATSFAERTHYFGWLSRRRGVGPMKSRFATG